jgi:Fe-S cluster assembly protein SufD
MTKISQNNMLDQYISGLDVAGFTDLRADSLQSLKAEGLPKAKEEEYKYTPVAKRIEQRFDAFHAAKPVGLTADFIKKNIYPGFEGDLLVFDNGHFDASVSAFSSEDYQVNLLSEALPEKLGKLANAGKDPFIDLNTVTFSDGIYIEVAKNKKVEKPILLMFVNSGDQGNLICPRIFIHCQAQAEVIFLESTVFHGSKAYFAAPVTEIQVDQNAKAAYYRLQDYSPEVMVVDNFITDIHRDANFTSVVVSMDADMVRNNLTLNLLGSGCEGNMYGLYQLNGKTHVDNHTNVDHTMPHAQSNELYKGILSDHSRGVFNGKIFVRQAAQKTNAFQQNNNILLSDDATVNTKPQLEIWADDVKCSHGCTTGQLDEEALFYLQSRGIKKVYAKGLLLFAFANVVLDHIKIESFQTYIAELVSNRLGSNV